MKYDANVFSYQYKIVSNFIQHLAYQRAMNEAYIGLSLRSEYWSATVNAHMTSATIYWCMVFGSDGANDTHWKNLGLGDIDALRDDFRTRVLKETGFTRDQWLKFLQEMCDFRNKFVAHREIGVSAPVPYFDKALLIAYAYDQWVRDLIAPDVLDGPLLKDEFARWRDEATLLAVPAMMEAAERENA